MPHQIWPEVLQKSHTIYSNNITVICMGLSRIITVQAICVPSCFLENLCPGVGHLSNLLEAVNVIPFAIFHLKICLFI